MTKRQPSTQNGVLKSGMTEHRQDLPSTNAASLSISGTLGITASQSESPKASQLTPNSHPNSEFRLIHALATKLGTSVRWIEVTTKDGRKGWALFFDASVWKKADDELVRK